jgi:hypothetical protein
LIVAMANRDGNVIVDLGMVVGGKSILRHIIIETIVALRYSEWVLLVGRRAATERR